MKSRVQHERARHLRNAMTDAERKLWRSLRNRQLGKFRFRRQQPIGQYIVDFACLEERIVIEVDGGQHADRVESDRERTEWLNQEGYRVLRFWNHQVLQDLNSVLKVIWNALNQSPPSC